MENGHRINIHKTQVLKQVASPCLSSELDKDTFLQNKV